MKCNCRLPIARFSATRGLQSVTALTLLLLVPLASFPQDKEKAKEDEPAPTYQDLIFLGNNGPVFVRIHIEVDGKPAEVAWKNFLHKWFKYLDRNGDGFLSKEEAASAPAP